jgi:hypothetical protein
MKIPMNAEGGLHPPLCVPAVHVGVTGHRDLDPANARILETKAAEVLGEVVRRHKKCRCRRTAWPACARRPDTALHQLACRGNRPACCDARRRARV